MFRTLIIKIMGGMGGGEIVDFYSDVSQLTFPEKLFTK